VILVSHPSGNAFVRAILLGLLEADELDSFHTTVSWHKSAGLLPPVLQQMMERRRFPVPSGQIHLRPWKEIVRLLAPTIGLNVLTRPETGWASVDAVAQDLDQHVANWLKERSHSGLADSLRYLSGVYAYEDSSLATFATAKELELKCFYDLPIAYWQTSQRLLKEEAERLPAWAPTLSGLNDSHAKLERKMQEMQLADVVICPSKFVYDSLPEVVTNRKTCIVSEFGTPHWHEPLPPRPNNPRLKVLFVGSLGQRKGLADLFAAIKLLKRTDIELVVMGSPVVSMDFYRKQLASFHYEPPRPHDQVLALMRTCDVFVLPSIVEGRALVQQEAMSCGLPLIATANAGAQDLIEDGRTGFLVPIRSPEKLAESIAWCADHRAEIVEMGRFARQKAMLLTWQGYCSKILDVILPIARSKKDAIQD
jgi:glycosyltransferase involved in cell wall biosynthesis